jgi:hypothetical protein
VRDEEVTFFSIGRSIESCNVLHPNYSAATYSKTQAP